MYQRNSFSSNRFSRGGGSSNQGFGGRRPQRARAIRTFDPSRLIDTVSVAPVEQKFVPTMSFADLAIDARLKATIVNCGYTQPTEIQERAIPELLLGKDVVGIANTGTGKTAAFLIPLINKVLLNRTEKVLILAPTRELALQIDEQFRILSQGLSLYSVVCIGGASISYQMRGLYRNPHFVIATPGRLLDLQERTAIKLNTFTTIVLDEVDRMLDMGFVPDIRKIISFLPEKRHSLFFSATMQPVIEGIMRSFSKDPVMIYVKKADTSANISQKVMRVAGRDKTEMLHDLLNQEGFGKVLIFGRTKHGVDKLAHSLQERGFKVASIHGDKTQFQRKRAIEVFKQNQVGILLATDVAARGLDIDNVTHVINYDMPQSQEDYIHRIGRTGRADAKGSAITFVD